MHMCVCVCVCGVFLCPSTFDLMKVDVHIVRIKLTRIGVDISRTPALPASQAKKEPAHVHNISLEEAFTGVIV